LAPFVPKPAGAKVFCFFFSKKKRLLTALSKRPGPSGFGPFLLPFGEGLSDAQKLVSFASCKAGPGAQIVDDAGPPMT